MCGSMNSVTNSSRPQMVMPNSGSSDFRSNDNSGNVGVIGNLTTGGPSDGSFDMSM